MSRLLSALKALQDRGELPAGGSPILTQSADVPATDNVAAEPSIPSAADEESLEAFPEEDRGEMDHVPPADVSTALLELGQVVDVGLGNGGSAPPSDVPSVALPPEDAFSDDAPAEDDLTDPSDQTDDDTSVAALTDDLLERKLTAALEDIGQSLAKSAEPSPPSPVPDLLPPESDWLVSPTGSSSTEPSPSNQTSADWGADSREGGNSESYTSPDYGDAPLSRYGPATDDDQQEDSVSSMVDDLLEQKLAAAMEETRQSPVVADDAVRSSWVADGTAHNEEPVLPEPTEVFHDTGLPAAALHAEPEPVEAEPARPGTTELESSQPNSVESVADAFAETDAVAPDSEKRQSWEHILDAAGRSPNTSGIMDGQATDATSPSGFGGPPEQPQSVTSGLSVFASPISGSEPADEPGSEATGEPGSEAADEPDLLSVAKVGAGDEGHADVPEFGVSRRSVDVRPFTESTDGAREEQYRALARRLRTECEPLELRSVLLIGVGDESELADLAVSLGAALSREARVLLVDGDLRDQRLTKAWRHTATPGLARALDEDRNTAIPVVPTTIPGFDFLPSGQPRRSIRREDSKLLADCLREFALDYETVLIDGGCLPAMPTELLAEACDATCVVVQLSQTETDDAKAVVRQVRELGGRVMGCIATNAPPSRDLPA